MTKIKLGDGKTADVTEVSDVDLDAEEIRVGGRRVTEDEAADLARRILAKHAGARGGRPSLGPKGPSPQVAFRVPPELRAKAEERAAREGKRVSEIAREALEKYLAS
jgi:hypothetical protein